MQQIYWLQGLGITISSVTVFWSNYSLAQITPDTTLSNNSNVTRDGNTSIIEGGTQTGSNLFHSFQEFSVPTGDTAFFNNATNIQNIISRVTGGSVSNIDGLIRANGTANLFLINSNGIIFGQNARLNIGGSFVGSTANSLKFADGFEFSATAPQKTPLLTINAPIGLQFGENPGDIRVQGIGGVRSRDEGLGLRVPLGKTLALVSGNVTIDSAFLYAPGGRIELGSVTGVNQVNLNQTNQGWTLNYQNANNLGNIQIIRSFVDIAIERGSNIQSQQERGAISIQASELDVKGTSVVRASTFTSAPSGNISINVQRLIIQEGASVITQVSGTGSGGDLTINASESVQLIGTDPDFPFPTVLSTETDGGAKAGSLTINTPVLLLQDYALVSAATFGAEDAGDLTINTGELVIKNGAAVDTGTFGAGKGGNLTITANKIQVIDRDVNGRRSGISASAEAGSTGNAGNLNITTNELLIQNGAQVATATFGAGKGGNLNVKADTVQAFGNPTVGVRGSSFLSTQATESSTGDAGDMTISTGELLVRDGAQVNTATLGAGKGGNLTIKADTVQLSGQSPIGRASSISTSAEFSSSGTAGNLTMNTRELLIEDRAGVFVRSQGTGNAGNLTIDASSVRLNNGTLTGDTRSVNTDPNQPQATINLRVKDLILLRRNSNITANATGENVIGGDVNIDTKFLAAAENSDITATSDDFRGGRVRIKAIGIFGTQLRNERTSESDITARGKTPELSGTIELNTPDVDPSRGLVELPVNLVDASQQIAQGCTPRRGQSNSFVITGRGGMPLSPSQPLRPRGVITQWVTLDEGIENETDAQAKPTLTENQQPIIEAQGWVVDKRGDVQFVAQVPNEMRIQESGVRSQNRFCSAGS
ncbi:S-layer family protein [Nostoc edaphicum CCNP1411]|uniref:S-layer family protein n=1 Tax=Nostoc edaphicum CCNP1411 TaxID=1472755 RepID=A0A7D7L8F0_9NOSO|nr:S-layer family protein [Nostoc edaphicum]QMS86613.1 S-layer family protein [Nostoc edaphicum CCNP1411]